MLKTLRSQIIVMVIIPVLGLTWTSISGVWDKYQTSKKFDVLIPLVEISRVASDVIHELQKERGRTVGMITSSYADNNVKAVADQRVLSDQAIAAYRAKISSLNTAILPQQIQDQLHAMDSMLQGIAAHRATADEKSLTVPQNVKFYTGIIHAYIDLMSRNVSASPNEDLTQLLLPYLSLVEAKEASGLERAIGAALFNGVAAGKYATPQYLNYHDKLAKEAAFLGAFRSYASPDYLTLYDETVQGDVVNQVNDWRKILAAMPDSKDGQGVTGKDWFDTATARINLIYSVERQIGEDALALAGKLSDDINAEQTSLILTNILFLVGAGAIGVFVGFRIARGLSTVIADIGTLSSGRHDFTVQMQERQDEFGDIAKSLEIFRKGAEERELLERQALEAQERAEQAKKDLIVQLAAEFEQTVGLTLKRLASQSDILEGVSKTLADRSNEGSSRSLQVAEQAQNASSSVDEIAANGDEMTASITEVAGKVSMTASTMQTIVQDVNDAADKISKLDTATQQIGNVVQVISDIAGQTNLLALNATIEAARAGEAGKGFAVVASEVKGLAQQTEKSTGQISEEILSIQSQTRDAVSTIKDVEKIVLEADGVVSAIAAAVEEQAATTAQMSESMQLVSQAANGVTEDISSVCQASAHSCGTGIKVLWTVDDLKNVKDDIQESSDKFLDALRGI